MDLFANITACTACRYRKTGFSTSADGSTVRIHAASITQNEIPKALCSALRTSFLFAGPLAARCGSSILYPPGGDVIGRRRLDSHFYGLKKLGIPLRDEEIPFTFEQTARGLHGQPRGCPVVP